MPDPSPKDTWSQQDLVVADETQDEALQKWPSSRSLNYPIEEEIPKEFWYIVHNISVFKIIKSIYIFAFSYLHRNLTLRIQ